MLILQIFSKKKKVAMFEALEKVKAELMVLGFISLLLTFGQNYIAKICIPDNVAHTMLPCGLEVDKEEVEEADEKGGHGRGLWEQLLNNSVPNRRVLSADASNYCHSGNIALISINGVHQLHIFIFFLAIFHVLYSALTMALGRAKIRRWKEWERETQSLEYKCSNDPERLRFTRETSFVRQHTSIWNKHMILFYSSSFFRQFFTSVRKTDYLTMRHGFVSAHLSSGSKFDFQKYIKRSLEDDFKVVVGISSPLWASAVMLLLLNVHGWMTLFWVSLLPLIILLAVGTKLQAIITEMALEIKEKHVVIQGLPLVKLSDHHFWFQSPELVLSLVHFTLFQNAFQIIYFLWIVYSFGLRSCFNENMKLLAARVCLGVGVQFLCSYVTLPLYALVSQMGSKMKRSVFDEQTSRAITQWHEGARRKQKKPSTHSATPGASPSASPVRSLFRYKTVGHSVSSTPPQRRRCSDHELSDPEIEMPSFQHRSSDQEHDNDMESGPSKEQAAEEHSDANADFSFVKLQAPTERGVV